MESKEKFLPIGTVVLLKGGKKELMITCYAVAAKGEVYNKNGKIENPEKVVYDYGACFYPEGTVTSDQIFVFNHDQIDKICFVGYETDKQKEYSNGLIKNLDKFKEFVKQDGIPKEKKESQN